jgi:hypothetical protein
MSICFNQRDGYPYYSFVNTVKSITESLSFCLDFNKIKHKIYYKKGTIDKRNGNMNKDQYNIYIGGGRENIGRFHNLTSFKMKGQLI